MGIHDILEEFLNDLSRKYVKEYFKNSRNSYWSNVWRNTKRINKRTSGKIPCNLEAFKWFQEERFKNSETISGGIQKWVSEAPSGNISGRMSNGIPGWIPIKTLAAIPEEQF